MSNQKKNLKWLLRNAVTVSTTALMMCSDSAFAGAVAGKISMNTPASFSDGVGINWSSMNANGAAVAQSTGPVNLDAIKYGGNHAIIADVPIPGLLHLIPVSEGVCFSQHPQLLSQVLLYSMLLQIQA